MNQSVSKADHNLLYVFLDPILFILLDFDHPYLATKIELNCQSLDLLTCCSIEARTNHI